MSNKYVVTCVTTFKTVYYVEVDNPEWAWDGIVCNELDHFSSKFLDEQIITTQAVDEFPKMERDAVNGATMIYDYDKDSWKQDVRWDLAE